DVPYGTLTSIDESPLQFGLIWVGSDDGLVHVTRDGGESWTDVTPRSLPEWALISIIDVSPHNPGTAYVAATRYKQDDFAPYIYMTTDYGRSWRKIVRGIPDNHFIRSVREDLGRPGLLYAAGEFGVYVSFDAGEHWQSLQLNLPIGVGFKDGDPGVLYIADTVNHRVRNVDVPLFTAPRIVSWQEVEPQ
ncbi:MAG: hypothetical protein IIA64_07410, partial [Planctomycetes bacterium]|nr:hypothetical protein [Planctomycetota bacterium]